MEQYGHEPCPVTAIPACYSPPPGEQPPPTILVRQSDHEKEPFHRTSSNTNDRSLLKAWLSCTLNLRIRPLHKTENDKKEFGVFAVHSIEKDVLLGPLEADVDVNPPLNGFLLPVVEGSSVLYYCLNSDVSCNWMKFVRPASRSSEQNVAVMLQGNRIYFKTITFIKRRCELRVWYSQQYAEQFGLKMQLEKTQASAGLCSAYPISSNEATMKNDCIAPKNSISNNMTNDELATQEGGLWSWICDVPDCLLTFSDQMAFSAHSLIHSEKLDYLSRTESCDPVDASGSFIPVIDSLLAAASGGASEECAEDEATTTYSSGSVHLSNYRSLLNYVSSNAATNSHVVSCFLCNWTHAVPAVSGCLTPVPILLHQLAEHVTEQHSRTRVVTRLSTGPTCGVELRCPCCSKVLKSQSALSKHIERLHSNSAIPTALKTTQELQCTLCGRTFGSNSALAVHKKTHSSDRYFICPVSSCRSSFTSPRELRRHCEASHSTESHHGKLMCCEKEYSDFHSFRSHLRYAHSATLECSFCAKQFSRSDKLKLHLLSHSDFKEFCCNLCSKTFKRKDKLKEHERRMHNSDNRKGHLNKSLNESKPEVLAAKVFETLRGMRSSVGAEKLAPRVSPKHYQRFIFKCETCRLGFKRRGMLVNHMAKCHPTVSLSTIPELNLPLLKPERVFYCQYCARSFRKSSTRNKHILDCHPNNPLPKKIIKTTVKGPEGSVLETTTTGQETENGNTGFISIAAPMVENNLTLLTGDSSLTITTSDYSEIVDAHFEQPFACTMPGCHKQFAEKSKLQRHLRKCHHHHHTAGQCRFQAEAATQHQDFSVPASLCAVDVAFAVDLVGTTTTSLDLENSNQPPRTDLIYIDGVPFCIANAGGAQNFDTLQSLSNNNAEAAAVDAEVSLSGKTSALCLVEQRW